MRFADDTMSDERIDATRTRSTAYIYGLRSGGLERLWSCTTMSSMSARTEPSYSVVNTRS